MAAVDHREQLRMIRTFPSLVRFLRDELDWPIETDDFEELTFEYTAEELGIDSANAAKIDEIKRLRPLVANQPWGVFFVKFEPKRLPVVALRRILAGVVVKKRATADAAEQPKWAEDDLLFISNYGEGQDRRISFAHFSKDPAKSDMPTLKVIAWDELDTPLHLDHTADVLAERLAWPTAGAEVDVGAWRERWRSAFELEHKEVITTSRRLAVRLAELARRIRGEILRVLAIETSDGKVTRLMEALRTSLVHDLDADGFADMYAQTIAYGLLSARIADPHADTADDLALHMRTNPLLRELLEAFLHVGGRQALTTTRDAIDFDELGVVDIVELLDGANMEAVVRDFGDRNPLEDPVIHFYELFLQEYDATKRTQRGVFYTPRPVVSYIVRRVDQLLRETFGLEDGLADVSTWEEMRARDPLLILPKGVDPSTPFVQILDPATGTGTFLVEVIDLIYKQMCEKWARQRLDRDIVSLWNEYVSEHLLPRLHAYELLMAPYAIAHLKVGLKLHETGYLFDSDARARIFLTNALEPADGEGQQVIETMLPALAREAQDVNEIKRANPFTVIIGNPPYAGHSRNNDVRSIVERVYDYKRDVPELLKPAQAKWLQDDYVKFIRLAEYLVVRSGVGVVGYITNHSYLDNPTFRGMRRHLLDTYGSMAVVDLHGNTTKREVAPDGSADENVFDIKQGVCITVALRNPSQSDLATVDVADVLGSRDLKYKTLISGAPITRQTIEPTPPFYLLRVQDARLRDEYETFDSVRDVLGVYGDPAPGIVTTHDEFAISFSRRETIEKVEALLSSRNEAEARQLFRLCGQSQWRYDDAVDELPRENWQKQVGPVLYRPFDIRYTVYNRHVAVHQRLRASRHFLGTTHNLGLLIGKAGQVVGAGEWNLVSCTRTPVDFNYFYRGGACNFPLYLKRDGARLDFKDGVNILPSFRAAIASLAEASAEREREVVPESIFGYIYAVLHSREYRARYAEFLKIDFPRIPRPSDAELFWALAELGAELISVHLLESSRAHETTCKYNGPSRPEVGRVAWANGVVWLDAPAPRNGQVRPGTIGFQEVPAEAWELQIGGYQVAHKWLKDRKGRVLSEADIRHYEEVITALTATDRLMNDIDGVIQDHGGWPHAFAIPSLLESGYL
jgi:Type ISP C-terminal specificity domain